MSSDPTSAAPVGGGTVDADAHLRSSDAGTVAATGGLVRLQMRILGLLFALGATVLVTRHLTEVDFGRLSLVVALVTVVSGVSDLGLSGVGIREWIRHDEGERRGLLADLLGLRIAALSVGAVLALVFSVLAGYGQTVVLGVLVAMVGAGLVTVQGALMIPLIAQLRQGLVGALELITVTVQAALQVVLVLAGAGVIPLAAAMIPGGVVGIAAVAMLSTGGVPLPRFRVRRLLGLLRESAAFAAAGAVSVVYLRSTVLLGPAFLTDVEFGAFAVAFRAIEPLAMLPAVLTSALFPILTHAALHDRARLSRGYDMLWRSTATLGALAATGTIGIAPLITLLFTGERSPITVDALVILGCALGAIFVGSASMWMLLAERRYRAVLAINLAALTINIGLTVVAGLWLGPRAFAIGIVAAEVVIALSADRVVRRGLSAGGHPTPAGPVGHLAKVLAAVAAGLVVFALTRDLFPLVPFAASWAAGGAVLLATRAVPSEMTSMARDAVGRLRPGRSGGDGVAP